MKMVEINGAEWRAVGRAGGRAGGSADPDDAAEMQGGILSGRAAVAPATTESR